jgi:CBS domain-containing protein
MARDTPVREVMTTEVVSFKADDPVQDAMRVMAEQRVDGAPVVDDTGAVVGIVSTSDLIVQETQLHYPTVISLFGAYLELPSSVRRFEEDLRRAVGATVGDVMNKEPLVCDEDDTLEQVATVMHEKEVSRMPVVHAGRLVGLISQGDILRAMLAERSGGA